MSDTSNNEDLGENLSPEQKKILDDFNAAVSKLKKEPHLSPFRRWLNTIGGLLIGTMLLLPGIMFWISGEHVETRELAMTAGFIFAGSMVIFFGLTAAFTGCDPIAWWSDSSLRKKSSPNLGIIFVMITGVAVSSLRIWEILAGKDNGNNLSLLDKISLVLNILLFLASIALLFLKPILNWWLMRKVRHLNEGKSGAIR